MSKTTTVTRMITTTTIRLRLSSIFDWFLSFWRLLVSPFGRSNHNGPSHETGKKAEGERTAHYEEVGQPSIVAFLYSVQESAHRATQLFSGGALRARATGQIATMLCARNYLAKELGKRRGPIIKAIVDVRRQQRFLFGFDRIRTNRHIKRPHAVQDWRPLRSAFVPMLKFSFFCLRADGGVSL